MTRDRGRYASLIDEETWAFIERTDAFYPPDAVDLSVARQREVYDRMCRGFFAGYPQGVSARDDEVAAGTHSIPVRLYAHADGRPRARIVYFHGGGFVVGGLESHDDICAEICGRTGCAVVSVAYRLAPESRHPAAFADALAGYDWAGRLDRLPLLLCGDSAGGNLAAAVAHARRSGKRPPAGQVLIYPALGGDRSHGSYLAHGEAPMLTLHDIEFYDAVRTGGRPVGADPTFAPLADPDFSGLPPTVIVTAACDPLSSDGAAYCARLRAAGGKAAWFDEQGLVHGYLRARHTVSRARESFTRIVAALDALADGAWPYR